VGKYTVVMPLSLLTDDELLTMEDTTILYLCRRVVSMRMWTLLFMFLLRTIEEYSELIITL